jgi:hypothetical protein
MTFLPILPVSLISLSSSSLLSSAISSSRSFKSALNFSRLDEPSSKTTWHAFELINSIRHDHVAEIPRTYLRFLFKMISPVKGDLGMVERLVDFGQARDNNSSSHLIGGGWKCYPCRSIAVHYLSE